MISIPLSLAFGLTVLYFTGYSINQISIAGFVVALGLLVDDSIVVVENIARHLREGTARAQAALEGTKQIFVAIIGCTATLIFAFLPLAALPGRTGQVHPRAAGDGDVGDRRLAADCALHHSIHREPLPQGERGSSRQQAAAAGDGRASIATTARRCTTASRGRRRR